jgi:GAF domain-containing protein
MKRNGQAMPKIYSPLPNEPPEIQSITNSALHRGLRLCNAELGNIQLMDSDKEYLLIASQYGFAEEFLAFFRRVTANEGSACARALRNGEAVIIEDVMSDGEFAPCRGVASRAGFRAVQSTPLVSSNGSVVGILSTHFPSPYRPSDQTMTALRILARSTADAVILHRARALSTARR